MKEQTSQGKLSPSSNLIRSKTYGRLIGCLNDVLGAISKLIAVKGTIGHPNTGSRL
jgi:hypothetical protein